jgi:hypothetical protein
MGFHGGKTCSLSPFITYQKKSSGSKVILMYRCMICPVKSAGAGLEVQNHQAIT